MTAVESLELGMLQNESIKMELPRAGLGVKPDILNESVPLCPPICDENRCG